MFKSATQIRSEAIARILAVRSDMSVLPGEPQIDLVDTWSIETAKLWFFADYLEKLNSVEGLLSIIEDETYKRTLAESLGVSYDSLTIANVFNVPTDLPNDVEAILYYDINRKAGDFGLARKPATRATGVERFYIDGPAAFSAPLGAKVSTTGTNKVVFSTTIAVSSVLPAFDAESNAYYVDIPIRADVAGAGGNLARNTIQTQSPAITRVVRVTNLAETSGGSARESNRDLLLRIQFIRFSVSINTRQGYTQWAEGQAGVSDAFVTGAGDTLMTRASAWGVDIWVQGEDPTSTVINVRVGSAGEEYILPFQPVLSVTSVVGSVVYTEGNGYSLVFDETGGYAHSTRAVTKIVWDSMLGPSAGEMVAITFSYDKKVQDLQAIIDTNTSVNVPASDVLVKRGIKWFVISEMKVVPLPDFTQSVAESAVQSALLTFMQDFRFGNQVDYSDFLVAAAEATFGGEPVVDRIEDLEIGRDEEFNGTPPMSTASLPAVDNEYYTLGQITFL